MKRIIILLSAMFCMCCTYAQTNYTIKDGTLQVDATTLGVIESWLLDTERGLTSASIFVYMEQKMGASAMDEFRLHYNAAKESQANNEPSNTAMRVSETCGCVTFSLNESAVLEPGTKQRTANDNDWRIYEIERLGAAHRNYGYVHEKQDGAYESTISGGSNQSASWSELLYVMLCTTSSGYPAPNCGCNKQMFVCAHGDARLYTNITHSGKKGDNYANAEAAIVVLDMDDDGTFQVLGATQGKREAAYKTDFNPAFITQAIQLGVNAGITIVGGAITPAQITTLTNQLTTLIGTPAVFTSGDLGDGENVIAVDACRNTTLRPNIAKHIRIVTDSRIKVTGDKGCCNSYQSYAIVTTDYRLTGVLLGGAPNTTCCVKHNMGSWALGSANGAITDEDALRTTVSSILSAYAPWQTALPVTSTTGTIYGKTNNCPRVLWVGNAGPSRACTANVTAIPLISLLGPSTQPTVLPTPYNLGEWVIVGNAVATGFDPIQGTFTPYGNAPGIYTFQYTHPTTGIVSVTTPLTLYASPQISLTSTNPLNCSNAATILRTTSNSTSINAEDEIVNWIYSPSVSTAPSIYADTTITNSGTYQVIATTAAGCSTTASVSVVSDMTPPTLNASASLPTTTVLNPYSQLLPNGAGYAWSSVVPSSTLAQSGTYTITATGTNGCTATQSVTVTFNAQPAIITTQKGISLWTLHAVIPDSLATFNWNTGATTDSINVTSAGIYTVTVSSIYGVSTATATVISSLSNIVIGTGTTVNSSTSYPAPFQDWFKNSKQYILLRAAELNAQGITGSGNFTQIGFNITSLNGIGLMENYTISMKNTTATALTSTADNTGFTQVYNPSNITLTSAGIYNFNLNTPFSWDGTSNVLIQICEGAIAATTTYTNNASTTYSAAGFNAYAHYKSDGTAACPITTGLSISANRPNTYLTFIAALPCTGVPSIGSTIASSTAVCSGSSATLSLQNLPAGSGITYQWQSSISGGTWTNIAGATSASYSPTVTVSTEYKCIATCINSGLSNETNPIALIIAPFNQCYCASAATQAGDTEILSVNFNGNSNTSTCATTATGIGSILNRYANYTTLSGTAPNYTYTGSFSAVQGASVPFSIEIGTCGGNFTNAAAIWIDFNQNGTFDTGEKVYNAAATTIGAHTESGNIVIPSSATLGLTRMRIINTEASVPTNPCGTYGYGETEDYIINIINQPMTVTLSNPNQTVTCNTPYTPICATEGFGTPPIYWVWSDGSNGNCLYNQPLYSQTYTVTATDANGSTATATTIVTVDNTPPAITIINTQTNTPATTACADAASNYCVQSNDPNLTYIWSNGATTACASDIWIPAEYTVAAFASNGCSSTAVITIVAPPTPVTLTVTADINNQTFTVTGSGFGDPDDEWHINGITTPATNISATQVTLAAPAGSCDDTYTISYTQTVPNTTCYTTSTVVAIANFWQRDFTWSAPCGMITVNSISGRNLGTLFHWSLRPCNSATPAYSGTSNTGSVMCPNQFPTGCYLLCISLPNSPFSCGDYCKEINITGAPIVSITGINTICPGTTITLTATGGGTYNWGGGITTATRNVTTTGTYTVTVTSAAGCTATASYIVTAATNCCTFAITDMRFTLYSSYRIVAFNTPTVSGAVSGSTITYTWDFGDGTTSTLANPTKTYNTAGVYTVCLTATATAPNGQVCSYRCCRTVNIGDPCASTNAAFSYTFNSANGAFIFAGIPNPGFSSVYTITNSNGAVVATSPAVVAANTSYTHNYTYSAAALPVGTYNVCRTVTRTMNATNGVYCEAKFCRTIVITQGTCGAIARFTALMRTATPLIVAFNSTSSTSATTQEWSVATTLGGTYTVFGSTTNPSYTFGSYGTYWVKLVINKGTNCEYTVIHRIEISQPSCAPYTGTFARMVSEDEVNELTSETTLISSFESKNEPTVQPNPTNGIVNIMLNRFSTTDLTISVFNLQGALLETQKLYSGSASTEFDLSKYPSGMYLITMLSVAGERVTQKVVKE